MRHGLVTWMRGGSGERAPARIFWVALAVRLAYMTLAHTWRIRPILDHFQFGWELGRIARSLATGQGYANPFMGVTGPTAWIPPLYTLLLAGVFKVFGVYTAASAWVIFACNSVFSAATALCVYEIAARCYGTRVALWSGWLWALYPAAMQYAVHWVWDMTLSTWLFAWVVVLALRMRGTGERPGDGETLRRWAGFGLLWGLLLLTNPTLLMTLPAVVLWVMWGAWQTRAVLLLTVRGAMLAGLIVLACAAPWVWRNWVVFHAFLPTRANLGVELYQSTLESNDGFPWGTTLPLAENSAAMRRYRAVGEIAYSHEMGAVAKQRIRARPRRIAEWTARRVYFFWASVPHPFEGSHSVEYAREVNYGFLSVTGLLGLALSLGRGVPAAWLFAGIFLLEPLVYYVVTVQARFRHPLEPLICVLTVYLFQTADRTRAFSWQAKTMAEAVQ